MTASHGGTSPEDIDELIERRFADLSPRLQQAARYIVDNPQHVAMRSMRMVASEARVDPSSMVRLAQDLGFEGYEALRDLYRRKLLVDEGAWAGRARRLQSRRQGSDTDHLLREILEQDQANLARTFSQDTIAALDQSRHMLSAARSIFVVGLRSLYPIAFYFHYACRLFNTKTVLLTGTGGTFADDLRLARAEDVMLVFSYRPYARDTIRAIDFAKSRGARVIAVTDSKVSPPARRADVTIVVANASTSLLPSVIPFFAIAQALATLLVTDGGEEAIGQIARSEEQLLSFRVYHDEARRRRQDPGDAK